MNIVALVSLVFTTLLVLFLFVFIDKLKKQNHMKNVFFCILSCLLICCVGQVLQIAFSDLLNIPAIYFDYFVYVGTCFLPISFLSLALIFSGTKLKFKSKYGLLFIIPIISLICLWTNNWHHLFFIEYSINMNEGIVGPFFYLNSIYTYVLFFVAILIFIKYSIKNSGFFSKQAILMCIGSLAPLIINLLGILGVVSMNIYLTPISFSITILCYTFAIFRFDFLKIAPIALQRIVDRMSDGYIIVNEENIITDFNQTFLELFSLKSNEVRNVNISNLLNKLSDSKDKNEKLLNAIKSTKSNTNTARIERYFSHLNKYFNIEINSIRNKDSYLGTLILLKDVTQHNIDMQTIKDNQDILIEKERLASLGQMIGGIAHNLKTPIMSIAGASEGLSDLIKEYDVSIGDSEVTEKDHHEIAHDMNVWIGKINTHLSYMSDIITAVKGQAVAFADNTFNGFTVEELIRHVDILMKHELKNALINLKTDIRIPLDTKISGNINSLVQVINNIISNAIQAYGGKTNQSIIFTIDKNDNNMVIAIEDFAGGLPKKVQEKLFKEMITTKGKNGTGLGLFMSYSNIKAHFNGSMNYKTNKGEGTTFYIEIPV